MKKLFALIPAMLVTSAIIFYSCQKEYSCEGCNPANNPPVADAGKDTSVTLSADSIILNGNASADPDNNIISYQWTKISGPSSFTIANDTSMQTAVSGLVKGIYQFELEVTDAEGLSDKDTVAITVNDMTQPNSPPVADAGRDQTITLPANYTNLDGSASSDPDNNIVSYLWSKISGPASFNIVNATTSKTQVTNLVEGIYQFELKVTDAEGLFDTDTIMVTVENYSCDNSNRPIVNAQWVPIGTLSSARYSIAVASAGEKIVFAGGYLGPGRGYSSAVDIFDISANIWSTANLSAARLGIKAITAGDKIFFAGGGYLYSAEYFYDNVDIYDVSDDSWSESLLSEPKTELAAAVIGNKVMFAGGYIIANYDFSTTKIVDVYDLSNNSWSLDALIQAREITSAVTVGQKIFFAGGYGPTADKIDIYDNTLNTWSTAQLSFVNGYLTGVTAGQKIYWAGSGCNVEIFDPVSETSTLAFLHNKDAHYSVVKDHKILFFNLSSNLFDIYDPAANQWSLGAFPGVLNYASEIICVNNTIYVAGLTECTPSGSNGGGCIPILTQLYKLEF